MTVTAAIDALQLINHWLSRQAGCEKSAKMSYYFAKILEHETISEQRELLAQVALPIGKKGRRRLATSTAVEARAFALIADILRSVK